MTECFDVSDVQSVGNETLADFDRRICEIPEDLCAPFHTHASRLEAELLMLYRIVVKAVKRQTELEAIATLWEAMVNLCDGFAKKISTLDSKHPNCGADIYYDRILELRAKCLRLQKMHA